MSKKHSHSHSHAPGRHAAPPPPAAVGTESPLPAIDPAHPAPQDVLTPPPPESAGATVETAPPAPTPEDELKDRLLRVHADFDNYRKRIEREKKDWARLAIEKLVGDLLPVLDHFEIGLADSATNGLPPATLEGFQLIYQQLLNALTKAGVNVVESTVGEPFDPRRHEAVSHLPSDTVAEGCIMAQIRRGYQLGDKLLRAPQVAVSSGPATP